MTIAEIIAALRCGNTVTAIDKQLTSRATRNGSRPPAKKQRSRTEFQLPNTSHMTAAGIGRSSVPTAFMSLGSKIAQAV